MLENGNLADDFYKELWLRAKQLSNDLTDMFLLRQDNNTIYYFVNDFGKYGPYGKQLQQPNSYEQTLFGVRVLRCPYKYVAEGQNCAVDISMDAYVQNEEEMAKVANFSFEGNAQLRKKNHQLAHAGSRSELVRGCPKTQYVTPDQRCVYPGQAKHLLNSNFVLDVNTF